MMGDSKLIISFMNRQYIPGKKEFAAAVEKCRRMQRAIGGQLKYYHIYRENNTEADWLSKFALKHEFNGSIEEIASHPSMPSDIPASLTTNEETQLMHVHLPEEPSPTCRGCQMTANDAAVSCAMCGVTFHKVCLPATLLS